MTEIELLAVAAFFIAQSIQNIWVTNRIKEIIKKQKSESK